MSKIVLLVDDDEAIRLAFSSILELEGYMVLTFSSGESALSFLRSCNKRPDVALIDLEMPGMSGARLLAEMTKDDALSTIPVAIITASNAKALGAPVIHKPLDIRVLLNFIAAVTREERIAA